MGSWTPVSCQCCLTPTIPSLAAIQLRHALKPEAKRWLISRLEGRKKDGGARLLVHPGEDDDGSMILLSATPYSLLRGTEQLGLAKPDCKGAMRAFSYDNRASFLNTEKTEEFLTLAERQFLVKHEADGVRVQDEKCIPGYPKLRLYPGQPIVRCLQKRGLIEKFYPLHDKRQLQQLTREWYKRLYLCSQPIDAVRAYFGDSVALYFSFLSFFSGSLVPMALLGVAYYVFSLDFLDRHILFAVFSVIWSTVTLELWKRHSATAAYRWGTLQLKSRFEGPRGQYWGPLGVNPITGRTEPYYPSWKRKLRMLLVSAPVVCIFLGLAVDGIALFLYWERWAQKSYGSSPSTLAPLWLLLPSITHTLYVELLNGIYKRVANILTEWENHRVESAFQYQLTLKVLLFRFFNCFAVLFYITFYMQDLQLLRKRLSSLLIISQAINHFSEWVLPYLLHRLKLHRARRKGDAPEDHPLVDIVYSEGKLPAYEGLFDDYMELFIQFGYASLFSCVYPLTAALLVLNNVMEMRTDALKLCQLYRKPFPCPASNIGVWQAAFETLGFFAVVTNCFLISISPEVKELCRDLGVPPAISLLYSIGMEHALIVLKLVVAFAIPDEPSWVRLKLMQMDFCSWEAMKQRETKQALAAS
ncbi:anoctamin-10-like [Ambystoma mexicanum]|uniref:anoctamin-10-like n=1 Tax=Ambystoma mexicanum TaxID=8296 RepID=UPI0037E74D49